MKEEDGYPRTLNHTQTRGHITTDPHIYKNVILVSKITKMPLWVENAGPMTWTG